MSSAYRISLHLPDWQHHIEASFPKKQACVVCYARVDCVAFIQPKAEAGGPRIDPFRRVRGDVTEIRRLCWRMRGSSNPRPHGALYLVACAAGVHKAKVVLEALRPMH